MSSETKGALWRAAQAVVASTQGLNYEPVRANDECFPFVRNEKFCSDGNAREMAAFAGLVMTGLGRRPRDWALLEIEEVLSSESLNERRPEMAKSFFETVNRPLVDFLESAKNRAVVEAVAKRLSDGESMSQEEVARILEKERGQDS